jgi:glutaconyl-CoA/methylmalonyl-CoA decarboxylase subunit gamma
MKKTLRITVNGKVYDVIAEILGDETAAPREAPATVAATSAPMPLGPIRTLPAEGPGAILSPIAGKVISIDAPVGTVVAAGQTVITLETMKMNTIVAAAGGGTVAAVHVRAGDAVEEGQLLVTLA